jgi:hypothetical protein
MEVELLVSRASLQTGDVQDVTTGELVYDYTIHQAFQKTKSGTGGGAGANGSSGSSGSK